MKISKKVKAEECESTQRCGLVLSFVFADVKIKYMHKSEE